MSVSDDKVVWSAELEMTVIGDREFRPDRQTRTIRISATVHHRTAQTTISDDTVLYIFYF